MQVREFPLYVCEWSPEKEESVWRINWIRNPTNYGNSVADPGFPRGGVNSAPPRSAAEILNYF